MNPNEKIFFFHIMKTGGTTLTLMLDKQYAVSQICPARQWHQIERLSPDELRKYKVFRGHFNIENLHAMPEIPFSITLIRNPVERVVSEYYQWRYGAPVLKPNPYHAISQLAQSCSLIEFARREAESGFFINNRQTYQLALPRSMPSPLVVLTPDQVIEKAKENLEKFSLVGTTNLISRVIQILCFHFGWMPPMQVPNLRLREEKAGDEISASVREELSELNRLDFLLYEQATELLRLHYDKVVNELANSDVAHSTFDHGMMQDQLRQHYESLYKIRHTVLSKELLLGFDQAIDGDGWYVRESDSEQKLTWRWSGPGTVSILDLPLDSSQNLRIAFDIVKVADPAILKTMRIRVNGVPLPYMLNEINTGVQTCSFDVPVDTLRKLLGRTRVSIDVDKTIKVADGIPRSQSFIFVGIAVAEFRVAPC